MLRHCRSRSLANLDLGLNMRFEGAVALVEVLGQCTSLVRLRLNMNIISDEEKGRLLAVLDEFSRMLVSSLIRCSHFSYSMGYIKIRVIWSNFAGFCIIFRTKRRFISPTEN